MKSHDYLLNPICLVVYYPSEKYEWVKVSWDHYSIPFPTVSGKSFKIPRIPVTTNQICSILWFSNPNNFPGSSPYFVVNSPPFFSPGKSPKKIALTGGPSRVATGLLASVRISPGKIREETGISATKILENWHFTIKDEGKWGVD